MNMFQTTFDTQPSVAEWIGLLSVLDTLIASNAELFRGRLTLRGMSEWGEVWSKVDVDTPAPRVNPLKAGGGGVDVFSLFCDCSRGISAERFELFRDAGVLHTCKLADDAFAQLLTAWLVCIQKNGYALRVELLRYSGSVQQVMEWVCTIFPDATAPRWLTVWDHSIHRPDVLDFRA